MSKRKAPLPLFDTLENFAEQVLPASIALPFAPADFQAVKGFLAQYQNNKMTFTAYRREIERLVQWAWYIHEKSVLTLNRADIEAFIKFCLKPPKAWIGFKREIRFTVKDGARLPNPRWRCFVAALAKNEGKRGKMASKDDFALSQKALAALFAGISSFYRYLVGENVVGANPVTQIRQKSHYLQTQQGKRKIRRLSEKAWTTVLACAQALAKEDARHERSLFILNMLYLLYLRVSELVASDRHTPTMGDFFQDSQQQWWFKTVSKGNKAREIAVSNSLLAALKRYRKKGLKLSPSLPTANEATPLLINERTGTPISSTRTVRLLVQTCFDRACEALKQEGFDDDASQLATATVHWLRHTGISDDINQYNRPIAHVRDDAGHSSSAITDLYNDADTKARHASARRK